MWILYNVCHLVHADLSEYNMLYHKKKLFVIDVSQSVEHDHPNSLEFLRMDCVNVSDYFRRKGVHVLGLKALFDFLTNMDNSVGGLQWEDKAADVFDKLMEENATNPPDAKELLVEEEVFKKSYIPRTLYEVVDIEKDIRKIKEGGQEMLYGKLTGLKVQSTDESESEFSDPDEVDTDNSDLESSAECEKGEHSDSKSKDKMMRGKRFEDPEEKKLRKAEAKEKAREKRQTKMPKHVKKQKEKKCKKSK
jgi:RIO kinase 1